MAREDLWGDDRTLAREALWVAMDALWLGRPFGAFIVEFVDERRDVIDYILEFVVPWTRVLLL